MIGFGAIGGALLARLSADRDAPQVTDILLRPGRRAAWRERVAPEPARRVAVHEGLDAFLAAGPELVVECAGTGAAAGLLPPVLERGTDVLVASVGALADPEGAAALEASARAGGARIHLCAGAIGGIDVLAAARRMGLDRVIYTSRKPPAAWRGTPAEAQVDLSSLQAPALVYEGTARAASLAYPKNANVATTVALFGTGLDRTKVRIFADPGIARNVHEVEAAGAFGRMTLRLENEPSPDNPKTSLLTVLSLEQAIRRRSETIVI